MSQNDFRSYLFSRTSATLFALLFCCVPAFSQQQSSNQQRSQNTVEGTVVSTSRETMVIKTDDNDFNCSFSIGTRRSLAR